MIASDLSHASENHNNQINVVTHNDKDLVIVGVVSNGQRQFNPPGPVAKSNMAKKLGLTLPKKSQYRFRGKGNNLSKLDTKKTKKIEEDGNCFFSAISYILAGDESEHLTVRNKIVDHMSTISNQLSSYSGKCIVEQYLSTMRCRGKWTTDVEIIAAANLLAHDIVSYTKRGNSWEWLTYPASFRITELSECALYIYNKDESHYEVVTSV